MNTLGYATILPSRSSKQHTLDLTSQTPELQPASVPDVPSSPASAPQLQGSPSSVCARPCLGAGNLPLPKSQQGTSRSLARA
ncbi:uncharacterized protein P884DRAFT_315171 [Thermothelomyces heterothallicus CBS 202.75]|uniref:uncharacterized protein n=1 Tax=Thermothelomyces heterothallicus CBS 202.75 TaxID=1149848 RepID=UPI0037435943